MIFATNIWFWHCSVIFLSFFVILFVFSIMSSMRPTKPLNNWRKSMKKWMLHVCSYVYIYIYYIYIMYIYIYRCFVFSHPWAHSQLCASGPAKNNGCYRRGGKRKSADRVGHPGTQTHGGTTWGQNEILILNNPHYVYIYIHNSFLEFISTMWSKRQKLTNAI
jgi:hypothetical protein